jgi:hypothetical protein
MPKPPKIPPLANIKPIPKPPPTHFTQTGPYAQAKVAPNESSPTAPNTKGSTIVDFRNPSPTETPRQRVARLREAARRARMQNLPVQERIIETGRVYMDLAHRGFVYLCIGIAGMPIVFCIMPQGKMITSSISLPCMMYHKSRH